MLLFRNYLQELEQKLLFVGSAEEEQENFPRCSFQVSELRKERQLRVGIPAGQRGPSMMMLWPPV